MKKTCSKSPCNIRKILYTKHPILNTKFGFTLVELLITISILAILFSIGVAQYLKFNRRQFVRQAALELKTNLTHAREMALSGKKECPGAFDGVLVKAIDDERYEVIASCNNGADTTRIGDEYKFYQGITSGGLEDPGILFKPLTGGTNLDVDKTITLTGFGNTDRVKVFPSGNIELVP